MTQPSKLSQKKYPAMFFFALMLLITPWTATAQETQVPSERISAEQISLDSIPTAPVLLDGHELFPVRGVSAYPAEERAKLISQRLESFAKDLTRPMESLRRVEEKGQIIIFAGPQMLMTIRAIDSQFEGGEEPQVLAQVYLRKIGKAVEAYREHRETSTLVRHAVYACVATGLLAFGWWVLRWMFNRFTAVIERRFRGRVKDLTIHQVPILQSDQIWSGCHGTLKTIRLVLMILLLYAYLNFVFSLFPWTASFGKHLLAALLEPLRMIGKGIVDTLPDLLVLGILAALIRYLLKLGKLIFANLAEGKVTVKGFDQEWAWPTYRIFRTLIIAFAVVMAYPYIPGSSSNAFKGVTIFLGVLLSLGSTAVIGNLLAGYTLVYRRAFRIGDRVKIKEYLGDVIERRLLVTHLRSLKNEEIIVPNSEILNNPVINYSSLAKQQGLILHRTVGIGYETPWRQVEAMLVEAARRTPGLLKDPPPFVLHQALGDFCITYELNVYCDKPNNMMQLSTLLSQNILDLFNEHGVQIMTPNYRNDPEQPKIVPKHQWFAPPAIRLEKPQGS
jgi:small-conductance mechanosensitive channel